MVPSVTTGFADPKKGLSDLRITRRSPLQGWPRLLAQVGILAAGLVIVAGAAALALQVN